MASFPFRIHGLFAAVFTPLDDRGNFVPAVVPSIVRHLADIGVSGIYITGSAGEGPLFTDEERKEIVECYLGAAEGRLPGVVQVGHNSLRAAAGLAAHAASAGASAISATPPLYFKPGSIGELINCLKEIASAAPELPFYYYHIPTVTGVNLDMVAFLGEAREKIPSLAGVKFSDSSLDIFSLCAVMPDFDLVYGRDEMLLPSLSVGAKGAVGSTYNYLAPLGNRIVAAADAGDWHRAKELQISYNRMVRAIQLAGGQCVLKQVLKFAGIDCGPNRLPLRTPSASELEALRAELASLGFYELFDQKVAARDVGNASPAFAG